MPASSRALAFTLFLCLAAMGARAGAAPPAGEIAIVEEILPEALGGGPLPREIVRELVFGLEKSARARVRWETAAAGGGTDPGDSLAGERAVILDLYAAAAAEYGRSNLEKARPLLTKLQDKIQSDLRRYLADPRLADALADGLLMLADVELRTASAGGARPWIESFVLVFPTRLPGARRYSPDLAREFDDVRAGLRLSGGSARLTAPGPGWEVFVNGTLVGAGDVTVPWLLQGTYWVFAASGAARTPVADLDVWNGKEARLAISKPAPPREAPLLVWLGSDDDVAAWDRARNAGLAARLTAAGAPHAVVLRGVARSFDHGRWEAPGVTLFAWCFDGATRSHRTALALPAGAEAKESKAALRALGGALGEACRGPAVAPAGVVDPAAASRPAGEEKKSGKKEGGKKGAGKKGGGKKAPPDKRGGKKGEAADRAPRSKPTW